MRSEAREIVFKYVFSNFFNSDDEGLFEVLKKPLSVDDKNFADVLYRTIIANRDKYLSEIERLAVGYKLSRVYAADKCAILLGMAERESFPDTPIPVVVDEAVKIAAKYSTEKSTDFVNGILANYIRG